MKIRLIFVALGAFAAGSLCGFYAFQSSGRTPLDASKQVREGGGHYTNPLLECDIAVGTIDAPKARFERELKEKVTEIDARDGITNVAVYYRDLNNGPAFGVNLETPFFPASLLKLPLMLAFYKHAEADPSIMTKSLTFSSSELEYEVTQLIKPEKQLQKGASYTVENLIDRMIRYSDNDALELLYPLLPEREYADLYARLGIQDINPDDPQTDLTVVEYSTFYRVLFNASFLNQANSEKVLGLLTQTTFDQGLRAGVPFPVEVAHKFGERDLGDGYFQLHDCGIVYVPNKPYLLCVMTRGMNQQILENAIRDISKFAYQEVTNDSK